MGASLVYLEVVCFPRVHHLDTSSVLSSCTVLQRCSCFLFIPEQVSVLLSIVCPNDTNVVMYLSSRDHLSVCAAPWFWMVLLGQVKSSDSIRNHGRGMFLEDNLFVLFKHTPSDNTVSSSSRMFFVR